MSGFEWSMGNGQCPACEGCGPAFKGHPAVDELGHEQDCELADLMDRAGDYPLMKASKEMCISILVR